MAISDDRATLAKFEARAFLAQPFQEARAYFYVVTALT
jgi:hypothetical protein